MRDLRRDCDSPGATRQQAWLALGAAGATLLSAVLFFACAFHLEAWGPPPLLLGAGVGLVGVLIGGVGTLGALLRLLAQHAEDDDVAHVLPGLMLKDGLGVPVPEMRDRGV